MASFLQDNELLNDCYKELKVKEDLKNIIIKKDILEKFNKWMYSRCYYRNIK